jgi:hypothetical protein
MGCLRHVLKYRDTESVKDAEHCTRGWKKGTWSTAFWGVTRSFLYINIAVSVERETVTEGVT